MVPVWSALIGALAALVGVWVTQALTNRREFQRDQLRWAQERQQREFDVQKGVMSEALLAHSLWLSEVGDLIGHLEDHRKHKPDLLALLDRETQAIRGFMTVELLCSDESIDASRRAIRELSAVHQEALEGLRRIEASRNDLYQPIETVDVPSADQAGEVMWGMAAVYRAELAKLTAEPVVLPQKPRKRLRLPWRKSA